MTRVLVCGGRDFDYQKIIWEILSSWHEGPRGPFTTLISGGARGVETHAEVWAKMYPEVPTDIYPAEWGKYGKSAGYKRNVRMLEEGQPDLVIAFPGGVGTSMMVALAEGAGVEVINYE